MIPKRLIIGLAGEIAAGKTTAARYLNQALGFSTVSTRELVVEYLQADQRAERGSLQEKGEGLLRELGPTGVCELICARLPEGSAVIDNLRMRESAAFFRNRFGDSFRLVYVDAPKGIRLKRYLARNPRKTRHDFLKADSHGVENQSRSLRDVCDLLLGNLDVHIYLPLVLSAVQMWRYERRLLLLEDILECVRNFNRVNNFSIGTADDKEMFYRQNLILEEAGEISAALTKGISDLASEHADLFIVTLANCVARGIDIEEEFSRKYTTIINRPARQVGAWRRVSQWDHSIESRDNHLLRLRDLEAALSQDEDDIDEDAAGGTTRDLLDIRLDYQPPLPMG